ncbi:MULTISPECIES: hypothetical protein [Niveibacterium]|uniref:Uncharacterized protein n=1 Tax=Niveibacterium microcysteis TaxID=2811415 RepID=A0ABX7M6P8_9RHOO|nr:MULTISPECIES: hypothetical protein [Niveibacterium]QSI77435.1 hypothetical protein JY500_01910 [Niveibacterium microcysteis]
MPIVINDFEVVTAPAPSGAASAAPDTPAADSAPAADPHTLAAVLAWLAARSDRLKDD